MEQKNNTNRKNMKENRLLQAQLSLKMVHCCKCEEFLKSPSVKKYRILIGQCKYVFINAPIAFLSETIKQT